MGQYSTSLAVSIYTRAPTGVAEDSSFWGQQLDHFLCRFHTGKIILKPTHMDTLYYPELVKVEWLLLLLIALIAHDNMQIN